MNDHSFSLLYGNEVIKSIFQKNGMFKQVKYKMDVSDAEIYVWNDPDENSLWKYSVEKSSKYIEDHTISEVLAKKLAKEEYLNINSLVLKYI